MEDYVEAVAEFIATDGVCRGVDLARYFGVSNVTVNRTISRLQRDGFVETEPYAPIRLTSRGRKLAAKCHARHVIVREFLLALGADQQTAEADAEGIEHHVSPQTLQLMQTYTSEQRSG